MINLSFLKEIDFANPDTLIFLAVFLVVAIIVFIILLLVMVQIIKIIKRIIIQIFDLDVKKPDMNRGQSTEWLYKDNNKNEISRKIEPPIPVRTRSNTASEHEHPVANHAPIRPVDMPGTHLEQKQPVNIGENRQEIKIPTPRHNYSGVVDGGFNMGTSVSELKQEKPAESAPDNTMFEGKPEVSRTHLEHEMRNDSKIWQAQRAVGLNFTAAERAKLVKDVFSPFYGRNISKSDLRQSINKLGKKLLDTKSSTEHAKIRKEIKFFKKIGGIK